MAVHPPSRPISIKQPVSIDCSFPASESQVSHSLQFRLYASSDIGVSYSSRSEAFQLDLLSLRLILKPYIKADVNIRIIPLNVYSNEPDPPVCGSSSPG